MNNGCLFKIKDKKKIIETIKSIQKLVYKK